MSEGLNNAEFATLTDLYFGGKSPRPIPKLREMNLIKYDGSDWVISSIGRRTVEILIKAVPRVSEKIIADSLVATRNSRQSVEEYLADED